MSELDRLERFLRTDPRDEDFTGLLLAVTNG
jgi:hypothetical protein